MTDSPLDLPPDDRMVRAFRLPAYVQAEPELVALHTEIVSRLRREAQGLPMNTVQQLLLERIAFTYVQMKWKDENEGYARTSEQKDFYTLWLSMTVEFNKLLAASGDQLRDALLVEVQKIVSESLKLVTNLEDRKAMRRSLSEAFSAIDV